MLIQVQKMVMCLRKMQQSDCDRYTEQLEDICKDQLTLQQFRNIMADNSIEEPTRKMASVFFKNYFLERYPDFEEVFFIQLVMSIILDERINYKLKVMLQDLIISMLEWIERENVVAIIDCIQNVFFILQRASGQDFLSLQKKVLKKRKDMDKTRLDLSKFCKANVQTQEAFINLSYSVIHLLECFSNADTIQVEDMHRVIRVGLTKSLTIFPIKKDQNYLRLQMVTLHMWLGHLDVIDAKKEKMPELELIEQEILEQEYLWRKIVESYEYEAFNFTGVQVEENLFVCSPQEPEKKLINKIKSYACQMHQKLLFYQKTLKKQTCVNKTTSPAMFNQMIKTLSYFSLHKNMQATCQCQTFICELLTLFIEVIKEKKDIIDSNWTSILHMIAFPLLTMDEKEFRNFEQEPEEFCRLAEDCCDKQRLGQLKTQAARLLETVSDRSLSYSQYIVQFCCLSIQVAIFKSQAKIQNPASLLPVQTAFLAITVLSYNLSHFKTQVSVLKTILISPQCAQLTQIDASRVFLFLAYNYSQVFQNLLQGKPWINYAMNSNLHFTSKVTALDFLLNIVDDYFEDQFLVLFSNKIVQDTQIRQVWQVLNKLLNHHAHQVTTQTYIILIEKIFLRMSADIIRYKERQIKTTANVNTSLQLLRKILIITKKLNSNQNQIHSNSHQIHSNPNQIRHQILKVIPQYRVFREIHLEDVVLKIINEFMEFADTLSQDFMAIFAQIDIIQQFRLENYRPTPFYWIFNQFTFKESRIDKLKQIKNILLQALKGLYQEYLVDKTKTKSNLPIAHCALILQHMLVLNGEKFTPQQIYEIYDLCLMMLPEDINEPQKLNFCPLIVGRILILMVLCYMLILENQNLENKKPINPLKYLLLFHDVEGVFEGHNAHVIVKLLCKGLFKQSDPVSVTEMINIMVRVMRPKGRQSSMQKEKSKSSKKSTKFKIKSIQNYEVILKKISKPFDVSISSEQQLRNTLVTMKQNNQPLYKSIISYLPTYIKDKLRDIVSTDQVNKVAEGSEKARRIMKVGGIRIEAGYIASKNKENDANHGKRFKNFDSQNENQGEVDENEVNADENIEKDKQFESQEKQEKKGNMKNMKKMKKLKANQFSQKQHNHQ